MKYRISHIINTDPDTFWKRIFFDDAYNDALYRQHLGFKYQVLESQERPDGTLYRRVETCPNVEIPAAVRKVVGDVISYVEQGTFDPKTGRYVVEVIPSAVPDKIKTHAEAWVEDRGNKRCERIIDLTNEVKIFGVGKLVEKHIEQQTRKSYDEAANFTNRWIAEQGL